MMKIFMIFTSHQILFRKFSQGGLDGQGMLFEWGRREIYEEFERKSSCKNLGVDGIIVLQL